MLTVLVAFYSLVLSVFSGAKNLSPSSLNVEPADKCSVLGIVVYLLRLHECAYVCFRRHLVQWRPGTASGDLEEEYPSNDRNPAS